jgi:hypothetical protein
MFWRYLGRWLRTYLVRTTTVIHLWSEKYQGAN